MVREWNDRGRDVPKIDIGGAVLPAQDPALPVQDRESGMGAVRFSLGRGTTGAEIEAVVGLTKRLAA